MGMNEGMDGGMNRGAFFCGAGLVRGTGLKGCATTASGGRKCRRVFARPRLCAAEG